MAPAAIPRLILAGGGDATDSAPLDDALVRWLLRPNGTARPLLYLPIAWTAGPYESCYAWIQSVFTPRGVHEITMWTELVGKTMADLVSFGAIYIGGGNTFKLLHHVRETGFDHVLAAYVRQGGIVYGGSAGAILLGEDIAPCAHLDTNDVGLPTTTGLGLAQGYAVWCHAVAADEAWIETYLHQHVHPVLALPERAGVMIQGEIMTAVGFDPVTVYRQEAEPVLVSPGEMVPHHR